MPAHGACCPDTAFSTHYAGSKTLAWLCYPPAGSRTGYAAVAELSVLGAGVDSPLVAAGAVPVVVGAVMVADVFVSPLLLLEGEL